MKTIQEILELTPCTFNRRSDGKPIPEPSLTHLIYSYYSELSYDYVFNTTRSVNELAKAYIEELIKLAEEP